jgi:hypothetical protein
MTSTNALRYLEAVIVGFLMWLVLDGRYGILGMGKSLAFGFPGLVAALGLNGLILLALRMMSGFGRDFAFDYGIRGWSVWAVVWTLLLFVGMPM